MNRYMLAKGHGMLVISQKSEPEFKWLLVAYYEDRDSGEIMEFMRKNDEICNILVASSWKIMI